MMTAIPTHTSPHTMMLVGSSVADCACMPLHGLSADTLAGMAGEGPDGELAFFYPPQSSFNYGPGCASPYGGFVDCYRRSLAENGAVRSDDIAQKIFDKYSELAVTGTNVSSLCTAFVTARNDGGSWVSCAQHTSDFPHALLVIPTVVARYADSHQLAKAVKNASRVIQMDELVDTACSLVSILLEYCLLTKCSPRETMSYFVNAVPGSSKLSRNEVMLLTSAMNNCALARVKDIHDIVGLHPQLSGDDERDELKSRAESVARILSIEIIRGGGGQGGSAAILLDNAPLTSVQKSFWTEAKQAAKASNRVNNDDAVDIPLHDACTLFGTGSSIIGEALMLYALSIICMCV